MNSDSLLLETALRNLGQITIVITPLDDGDATIYDRHTRTLYVDPRTPGMMGAIRECLVDQLPQTGKHSMRLVSGGTRACEADRTRPHLAPVQL